jgi:tight adherence protein B
VGAFAGLLAGLGGLLIWRSRSSAGNRDSSPRGAWRWWARRRVALLRHAGIANVGPLALLAAQGCCALVAGGVVVVLTAATAVGVILAAFGFALLPALLRRQGRIRRRAVAGRWPDVMDDLASAIRAGLSLPDAMSALESSGPAELRPAFARFATNYRASGRFGACLDALRAELADPVADQICETVRLAREVGGRDLAAVLLSLSQMLRANEIARAELETRQGWVLNAARLAVAAPWVVLLLLGTGSSTLAAYDTEGGVVLLAIGAGVCVLAYRVMLRLGRLPEPARVLSTGVHQSPASAGASV